MLLESSGFRVDTAANGREAVEMTANAFSEDVQAAKAAGMNGHIAKPLDVSKMIRTLAEILSGSGGNE